MPRNPRKMGSLTFSLLQLWMLFFMTYKHQRQTWRGKMSNRYRYTSMYFMLLKQLWSQLKHQLSPKEIKYCGNLAFMNRMLQFQYNLQIFGHWLLWFCGGFVFVLLFFFFFHRFHILPILFFKGKGKNLTIEVSISSLRILKYFSDNPHKSDSVLITAILLNYRVS